MSKPGYVWLFCTAIVLSLVFTAPIVSAQSLTASAGPDQTVVEGAAVTLDGSGNPDPGGTSLTYAWTQTGGVTVPLSGANTASLTFTVPDQVTASESLLTFRLRVTDANGMSSPPDTVTIKIRPLFTGAVEDKTYVQSTPITVTLPKALGRGKTYTLTPPLPEGLSFNGVTRILSGTPTQTGGFSVTYGVTDENGGTDSLSFTIIVNAPLVPDIRASVSTLIAVAGRAITPVTIDASAGGRVARYAIAPPIDNGLSFDTTTGTISGMPDAVASEVTYTITASNAVGTDTVTVAVTVIDIVPDIRASVSTLIAVAGRTITPVTIDASAGGRVARYAIAPPIDNGLSFDTTTGTISGMPDAVASEVTYTITASNAVGTDTVTVAVTVIDIVPDIRASVSTVITTAGRTITPVTIDASVGGRVARYAIAPPIDNGLSFDTTTGTISGMPDAVASEVTYTITASNAVGTDTVTVVVMVVDMIAASAGPDQTVAEGATVTLDGRASFSPSGETLGYIWTQVIDGAPRVSFSRVNVVRPTVTAPSGLTADVDLVFELIVFIPGGDFSQDRVTVTVDATIPVITLTGEASVSIELGADYMDAGAMATDNIDGDITADIVIVNNVDTDRVGSYTITYNVRDAANNAAAEVTRTVTVTADATIPVITLTGETSVSIELGTAYTDARATATDNIDGDITVNIAIAGDSVDITTVGSYTITYNVRDAANNAAAEVTRTVTVTADATIPVITLTGETSVSIELGTAYTDARATATDNIDGDITVNIAIAGDSVDITTVGSYTITYNVRDAANNAAAEVTRTVTADATIPVITLTGETSVSIELGTAYTDARATATDNIDGDITANIAIAGDSVDITTVGSYTITYNVRDAANNAAAEVTRTVTVTADATIPVITLTGETSVSIELGTAYTDARATATDNIDGDITANIAIAGDSVDITTVGSYTITYNVRDAAGNAAIQK